MAVFSKRVCRRRGRSPSENGKNDRSSRLHRVDESLHTKHAHHALQVVRQDVQAHLGTDVLQALHLEVLRTCSMLDGAERMFHSLATYPHHLRVFIEPLL